jgi:hypothetical protein
VGTFDPPSKVQPGAQLLQRFVLRHFVHVVGQMADRVTNRHEAPNAKLQHRRARKFGPVAWKATFALFAGVDVAQNVDVVPEDRQVESLSLGALQHCAQHSRNV